ncbi:arylmalonate decarboxylase [Cladophialophora yegresii CBS 114405]|uniref:Arylmalonate decarboxylase n=1 Tax=Cladophialophora yegresii CBS 114405 TaxID=1182544 RepID=W9VUQ3_9EURO|nr:arylmalonate decarboxylase [Cladophialophora yegresii CBS 114405]EXJ56770.1 arylmalonate decarboxylase [Cladophialophora yegresii CBS 114405]
MTKQRPIRRIKFGVLVPSSNTVLEPLTQQIVSQLHDVSVHFSRFRVLKIALDPAALAQFDNSAIIEAAHLLADAKVDVIGWSGTSAGWLGFDADAKLCDEITAATGIPATTSVLGLNRLIRTLEITQMGLLTPYTDDVQLAIMENYRAFGVDCSVEHHLGQSDNAGFADISEETLDDGFRQLARRGARVVSVFCTGLRAAHLVDRWEAQSGITVLDTVATVLWDLCRIGGVDTRSIKGWGILFQRGSQM